MSSLVVTLMMWVTGCALIKECPVKAYEVQYYASIELCEKPRDVWRGISPDHIAECIPRNIKSWWELLEDPYEVEIVEDD